METNEVFVEDVEIINDETESIDEEGKFNPAIIIGAVAGVGALAGGAIALGKKHGGKVKAKMLDMKEKRLLKKIEKDSEKMTKIEQKRFEMENKSEQE